MTILIEFSFFYMNTDQWKINCTDTFKGSVRTVFWQAIFRSIQIALKWNLVCELSIHISSTKPKKLINHHYYGLQGVTVRTLAIFEISICRRIISHRNINTLQTFMKFATDVLQTLLYLKEKLIPSWYQNIWLYRWVLAKFVNFSKKHNEVCFWENIDLEQIDLI